MHEPPADPQPTEPQAIEPQPTESGCAHHGGAHHGYIHEKDALLRRMKRIEGQVRGVTNMIDKERYCIDILTQVSALTSALQRVATALLDDHLQHCVLDAARASEAAGAAKLQEASDAIARLVRS